MQYFLVFLEIFGDFDIAKGADTVVSCICPLYYGNVNGLLSASDVHLQQLLYPLVCDEEGIRLVFQLVLTHQTTKDESFFIVWHIIENGHALQGRFRQVFLRNWFLADSFHLYSGDKCSTFRKFSGEPRINEVYFTHFYFGFFLEFFLWRRRNSS